MLDSELHNAESGDRESNGHGAGQRGAEADMPAAVPAAVFQAPQVLFHAPATPVNEAAPAASETGDAGPRGGAARSRSGSPSRSARGSGSGEVQETAAGRSAAGRSGAVEQTAAADTPPAPADAAADADEGDAAGGRRRRRRSTRGRGRADGGDTEDAAADQPQASAPGGAAAAAVADGPADDGDDGNGGDGSDGPASGRRRRRKRRRGAADTEASAPDDPPDTVVHVREQRNPADDVRSVKGSTRLEAKKQRRREGRESGRRRPPIVTESEFLARRESVERTMVVRQRGDRTQIAVLEDGVLVEHYVNRTTHQSYVGNVYLGKVQNVLPSMEAAFVDIGKGRNAVLYAGEVNFDASGLEGQPKRIESALKPGQSVIVQVTKDPVGHKGARLTSQVSLPGRYLVYVPGASMTGISRKLPDTERNRLKQILKKVMPENAGVIVRTAAEGAAEEELDRDVARLAAQWENIERKAKTASAPALLYGEPDLTIRVVRDVFNEDFSRLIVSGDEGWDVIDEYVRYVAPHLAERLSRWPEGEDEDGADAEDVFAAYRIDEQLAKALERKVWLPSGGSLVIDRTEAMTVVDVNTGKFTGQGGNLEETVTRNNLEAAEEIVRQLRLRDVGGIVVIDFIDMVLESNRELVLRRMLECLARDRTKHQVAEVTSLGLVQMTRKRVGAGLLEAFSEPCECCNGRGVIITLDQPEQQGNGPAPGHRRSGSGSEGGRGGHPNGKSAQDSGKAAQDTKPGQDTKRGQDNGRRGRRGTAPGVPAAVPAAAPAGAGPAAEAASAAAAEAATGTTVTGAVPVSATPGRRTRAGSAVARVAAPQADEATAAAPAPGTTWAAEPAAPETPAAGPLTLTAAVAAADAAVARADEGVGDTTEKRPPAARHRRRKTAPEPAPEAITEATAGPAGAAVPAAVAEAVPAPEAVPATEAVPEAVPVVTEAAPVPEAVPVVTEAAPVTEAVPPPEAGPASEAGAVPAAEAGTEAQA